MVRQATAADADAVADVLADAFTDYEWTNWTVDADDRAGRIAELQRLAFTELVMPLGEAWIATEDDRVVSAALWMRPDRPVPESTWRALEPRRGELEGHRYAASVEADACLSPYRPDVPHYFLGAVGTATAHQRRGFARAVLAPVLDRLDAEGAFAYLETCGADNVAFYRSLGFSVTGEVQIPDGGPIVWTMTRN